MLHWLDIYKLIILNILFFTTSHFCLFFFLGYVYNCFCLAFGFNRVFFCCCLFRVCYNFSFCLCSMFVVRIFLLINPFKLFVFVFHFFFFQFRSLCFRSLCISLWLWRQLSWFVKSFWCVLTLCGKWWLWCWMAAAHSLPDMMVESCPTTRNFTLLVGKQFL